MTRQIYFLLLLIPPPLTVVDLRNFIESVSFPSTKWSTELNAIRVSFTLLFVPYRQLKGLYTAVFKKGAQRSSLVSDSISNKPPRAHSGV